MKSLPIQIGVQTFCNVIAVTVFAAAAVLSSAEQHPADPQRPAGQALDAQEILRWLPPDTESLVVAKGPFPLRGISARDEDDRNWFTRKASETEIQEAFERLPLEILFGLDVAKPLQGTTVALAMQGSRHFREPLPGLEVMDFEGCSVVIFENNLDTTGDSLLRKMERKATRTDLVSGIRVFVFHQKVGTAEWDNFLALPSPDILLAANNLSYLREIVERMAERKSKRALPADLPEWRNLDRAARFWAIRHYDRTQASRDPTSPFGKDRTFGESDPKAIGVLVALDPNDARHAVITFFSGDVAKIREVARAKTIVSEPQEGVKFEVGVRSPGTGILEHSYTLDRSSTLDYFILNVEVMLGRGMYF